MSVLSCLCRRSSTLLGPAVVAPLLALSIAVAPAFAAAETPVEARSAGQEQGQRKSPGKRRVARRHPAQERGESERASGGWTRAAKDTGKKATARPSAGKRGGPGKATSTRKSDPKKAERDADKPRGPLSIGAPNRGRLVGAVRLSSSKHLRARDGARTWGLPVLVKSLRRAALKVAGKHRGSVLLVGDLSAKRGGTLDGHNSHQTGRDADVGFYVASEKGKPLRLGRFVPFDARGNATGIPGARFDDARNWALVEALLADRRAGFRYVFVMDPLKARLLAYAAKKGVSEELRARAAAAMMSPSDADLHNDHFHVRIGCPESMRGTCVEESSAREEPAAGDAREEPAAPAAGDATDAAQSADTD
jgi:penicillin-insensitive murein DD-endopeptidase